MKIDVGAPFLHNERWGSRVTVEFGPEDGGAMSYDLHSRGKAPEAVHAEIVALRAAHRARMDRHNALSTIKGNKDQVSPGWTLTDAYVAPAGTDWRLHAIAWGPAGEWLDVEFWHADPSKLPNNDAVLTELSKKIADHEKGKAAHSVALASALKNLP